MSKLLSNRLKRFLLIIGLLLVSGSLILAVLWFTPRGAFVFAAPTPTQEYTWAYVEIAKPAKVAMLSALPTGTSTMEPTSMLGDTATPTLTEPSTPLPTMTETPGEMVMEILENTPTPVYVAPTKAPSVADAPVYTYSSSKYILVDISEQHMYVYDGDALVYSFVVSTGINNGTRVGTFAVQSKIPNAYGSTWDIWMPNWLGIYWAGGLENGIHALPILPNGAILWDGYLGRPVSYGCVVLGTYESSLLYNWAEIGTTVEIQW